MERRYSPDLQAAGVLLAIAVAVACWVIARRGRKSSTSPLAGVRSLRGFEPEEVLKDEVRTIDAVRPRLRGTLMCTQPAAPNLAMV